MIKKFLFKFLQGKLADASLIALIIDLVTDTPEMINVFTTASGESVSAVGVASAVGYLWGVIRRFFAEYKYDA